MLKTEQNTRAIERKVRGAFREWAKRRTFETFYEHGQWWVRVPSDLFKGLDYDVTYSVVDANTSSGFDFERID